MKQLKCILCDGIAATVCWFPFGCTCAPRNYFQPRCAQHTHKAADYEHFYIIESFWPEQFPAISMEEAVEYYLEDREDDKVRVAAREG